MKTISVVTACVTGIILLALGAAPGVAETPRPHDVDQAALHALEGRLDAYVALRRRLEAPLPPLQPTTDMESVYARQATLASAIKAARPHARRGEVFTPTIADHVRRTMLEALHGVDVDALLRELLDEHAMPRDYRPQVHDAYPGWATHAMPAILLFRLPPLPEDIEYRLIGHDLILLDLRAGLIIDVLPQAIPRGGPFDLHHSGLRLPAPAHAFDRAARAHSY